MLLGVISDTHGQANYTLDGLRMLDSLGAEILIHCGDIGGINIPQLFQKPTHFVRGNVDSRERDLRTAVEEAGHIWHGQFGEVELGGVRIAFLHGDDFERLNATIASEKYPLVCHGHTHVAECRTVGKTIVLNPGAMYRAMPHTVAIVQLPELKIDIVEA